MSMTDTLPHPADDPTTEMDPIPPGGDLDEGHTAVGGLRGFRERHATSVLRRIGGREAGDQAYLRSVIARLDGEDFDEPVPPPVRPIDHIRRNFVESSLFETQVSRQKRATMDKALGREQGSVPFWRTLLARHGRSVRNHALLVAGEIDHAELFHRSLANRHSFEVRTGTTQNLQNLYTELRRQRTLLLARAPIRSAVRQWRLGRAERVMGGTLPPEPLAEPAPVPPEPVVFPPAPTITRTRREARTTPERPRPARTLSAADIARLARRNMTPEERARDRTSDEYRALERQLHTVNYSGDYQAEQVHIDSLVEAEAARLDAAGLALTDDDRRDHLNAFRWRHEEPLLKAALYDTLTDMDRTDESLDGEQPLLRKVRDLLQMSAEDRASLELINASNMLEPDMMATLYRLTSDAIDRRVAAGMSQTDAQREVIRQYLLNLVSDSPDSDFLNQIKTAYAHARTKAQQPTPDDGPETNEPDTDAPDEPTTDEPDTDWQSRFAGAEQGYSADDWISFLRNEGGADTATGGTTNFGRSGNRPNFTAAEAAFIKKRVKEAREQVGGRPLTMHEILNVLNHAIQDLLDSYSSGNTDPGHTRRRSSSRRRFDYGAYDQANAQAADRRQARMERDVARSLEDQFSTLVNNQNMSPRAAWARIVTEQHARNESSDATAQDREALRYASMRMTEERNNTRAQTNAQAAAAAEAAQAAADATAAAQAAAAAEAAEHPDENP